MSLEEDYLMEEVRRINKRVSDLEEEMREWRGNSSPTSTESQPKNSGENENAPQSPAPTTARPSEKDRTENSSAVSTAGSGPETPPSRSASKADWVKFVRSQGFEEDGSDAGEYSKKELIEWWESD